MARHPALIVSDLCLPYKIGRHNISRECIPPFADEYEDRGRYGPGWVRFDANNPYHILREEYRLVVYFSTKLFNF